MPEQYIGLGLGPGQYLGPEQCWVRAMSRAMFRDRTVQG